MLLNYSIGVTGLGLCRYQQSLDHPGPSGLHCPAQSLYPHLDLQAHKTRKIHCHLSHLQYLHPGLPSHT